MPHPSSIVTTNIEAGLRGGWGEMVWGAAPWGGSSSTGFSSTTGGQIVIRHDRSTTKKKRLRQRQRMN